MSAHNEIPVGTRVICVHDASGDGYLGRIGVVIGPLEPRRCWTRSGAFVGTFYCYVVDFGDPSPSNAPPNEIKPLPPEDDVLAFDRKHRDVEIEVKR